MSFDLTIKLDDYPGALADLGIALGKAGINLEGICAFVADGKATIHILVEDVESSRQVLEKLGLEVSDEPKVLVIPIRNSPGEIGQLCRRLANAGINLDLVYLASDHRLVVGGENLERALAVL
jgi:hypothetical protein